MILEGEDRSTITDIINWFAQASFDKYSRGVREHGGVLTKKGGLLNELEMECLDHVIYVRTIRSQLQTLLALLDAGRTDDARHGLSLLVNGTPRDRMPSLSATAAPADSSPTTRVNAP
jgi:hypothetical protein